MPGSLLNMLEAELERKIELYEHCFRDPKVGDGRLQPPLTGIACRDLRAALARRDYPIAVTDIYDQDLKNTVASFQTAAQHNRRDGIVGRRTRRLLTKAVIERDEEFFRTARGLVSPEYAVFLSYARDDEDPVVGIANGIRASGIPVFRDADAIPPGANWPSALFRSIQRCQVFRCMISPHSITSINVLIEVALARHAERPILPIHLAEVELPVTFRSLIGNIHRHPILVETRLVAQPFITEPRILTRAEVARDRQTRHGAATRQRNATAHRGRDFRL